MIKQDQAFAGLVETGEQIARGETTALAVTRACLARIARWEPDVHAFALVCADEALATAREADREIAAGRRRGPLHGVPVAVKDLIDMAGLPTTAGTRLFDDNPATADATVVARLREAGAVIVGKAQMTEGATAAHHPSVEPPRNPWNPGRSSGASSSGSGVCVAAGLCHGALGSDTGGSIRIPSAMNGITGLKPGWGRVSRKGVFPLVEYLDTIGPMACSARDAAALFDAIAGHDPADPTSDRAAFAPTLPTLEADLAGMRLGLDAGDVAQHCAPALTAAVKATGTVLRGLGLDLREVAFPTMDLSGIFPLVTAGMAEAHRATFPARADEYGPGLRATLEAGAGIGGPDVAAAINRANEWRGALAGLFEEVDLLLVPALLAGPPPVGFIENLMLEDPAQLIRLFRYTGAFNVAGLPTITFPAGFDEEGLPLAVQLVAPLHGEALLLRAAHQFQLATAWHQRHPDLDAVFGQRPAVAPAPA